MTLWTKRITVQSVFCPSYRKSMRGSCIISCQSFLAIFSIPIWQPFVRVLDVSLPCCAFLRTGGWDQDSLLVKRRNDNHSPGVWVWLNVSTAPHYTARGKIQYRTNGNYRTLPSMFPFFLPRFSTSLVIDENRIIKIFQHKQIMESIT